jgi:gamma-glutamyl hercynylcysteine S-oxide synthase
MMTAPPASAAGQFTPALSRWARDVLTEARQRTLELVAPLSSEDLCRQHDPLMSPIVWDLGHIAGFEELWLLRNLSGPVEFGEMPGLFNPFEHPRAVRGGLPLPTPAEIFATLREVRERVLEAMATLDADASASPLLRDGYLVAMVAQHEYQHGETILQTLQLKRGDPYRPPRGRAVPRGRRLGDPGAMVRFPGGDVEIGTDDRSVAYDNERPRHSVRLAPFWIDVTPVTNGDFLTFMDAGGYLTSSHWSMEGWRWLQEAGVQAPKYWFREDGAWWTRSMSRVGPVDFTHPVCHVSYYEAEAFARWAGKRLPSEQEWEAAASWDPARGWKCRYPWGEEPPTVLAANVDQLAFGTAPVGAYPGNCSPIGCTGMIGDVWEWTSSRFAPWPGFTAFPYAEYSEVFFGDEYRVLRGGSWATRPGAVRATFRNWDYPQRRQIFSGFRCARDG